MASRVRPDIIGELRARGYDIRDDAAWVVIAFAIAANEGLPSDWPIDPSNASQVSHQWLSWIRRGCRGRFAPTANSQWLVGLAHAHAPR